MSESNRQRPLTNVFQDTADPSSIFYPYDQLCRYLANWYLNEQAYCDNSWAGHTVLRRRIRKIEKVTDIYSYINDPRYYVIRLADTPLNHDKLYDDVCDQIRRGYQKPATALQIPDLVNRPAKSIPMRRPSHHQSHRYHPKNVRGWRLNERVTAAYHEFDQTTGYLFRHCGRKFS